MDHKYNTSRSYLNNITYLITKLRFSECTNALQNILKIKIEKTNNILNGNIPLGFKATRGKPCNIFNE